MNAKGEGRLRTSDDTLDSTRLERSLGYTFSDSQLLRRALTHSSASATALHSNERLEFLGDRVLGLVIAKILLSQFPEEDEGALGYRFTALARAESLARVAEEIGLSDHIILSPGEQETGGRRKEGIIANACEAVIAALFIDGGFEAAEQFIQRNWQPLVDENVLPPKDAKTRLQELAQSKGLPLPSYDAVDRRGPDHSPTFVVEVSLGGYQPVRASGPSKRTAEQAAAALMLKSVE